MLQMDTMIIHHACEMLKILAWLLKSIRVNPGFVIDLIDCC